MVTPALYFYLHSIVLDDFEGYIREHLTRIHTSIHTFVLSLHTLAYTCILLPPFSGILLSCVDLSWAVLSLTRAVLGCWYRFDAILRLGS